MRDCELMDFHMIIKDVYGSFKILDDINYEDIPAFYKFTKIVWNYTKMTKILKDEQK